MSRNAEDEINRRKKIFRSFITTGRFSFADKGMIEPMYGLIDAGIIIPHKDPDGIILAQKFLVKVLSWIKVALDKAGYHRPDQKFKDFVPTMRNALGEAIDNLQLPKELKEFLSTFFPSNFVIATTVDRVAGAEIRIVPRAHIAGLVNGTGEGKGEKPAFWVRPSYVG